MAGTGEARIDDPRDVGTRIDLKALTHLEEGSAIVYTAETYAPFADQAAAFKWGIDRDHDEGFDLIVFTEWGGGKLIGGVKDAAGAQIAPATVSRPGPTVIRVSFPAELLGGAPVYRYAVDAEADFDGDGPSDPGERDLVPNSGLIQHRLGAVAPAAVGETPTAGTPPARTEAAAPARTATAAPPAAAAPDMAPAATATPGAAPPAANLPRTGPADRALLSWSGAALMVGGALVALGTQRKRVRRCEVRGGIR